MMESDKQTSTFRVRTVRGLLLALLLFPSHSSHQRPRPCEIEAALLR